MITPLGWAADRWTLGPRALRWGTTAALVASILIVLGGVVVRVTGSGLGCPTWPTCTEDSLISTPELGIHGAIEFGNRLITGLLIAAVGWAIVAARLQRPRDRMLTRLAWSMFWLVVANALAGGITVLVQLNPWVVALHFVLAMGLLACATFTWHRARWSGGGAARPSATARAFAWALVVAAGALVVTGTLVTGSGPHAGDSKDVPRMGFDWTTVVVVHGAAALAVLVLAVALAFRLRADDGGALAAPAGRVLPAGAARPDDARRLAVTARHPGAAGRYARRSRGSRLGRGAPRAARHRSAAVGGARSPAACRSRTAALPGR